MPDYSKTKYPSRKFLLNIINTIFPDSIANISKVIKGKKYERKLNKT